jgi:hypothetical protein
VEILALGGDAFERALAHFRGGGAVTYRGMTLVLRAAEFACTIPWTDASSTPSPRRALALLTRARFQLGALLASAPPLAATVGNREPRLVLVGEDDPKPELFELRGDRLRRL